MKLTFLWDEEKTRTIYRFQLIVFFLASFGVFIITLFWQHPHSHILSAVAGIYSLWCTVNLFFINKGDPGTKFLLTVMVAQPFIGIFMALTGGFTSIVQFAPVAILVLTAFQLGPVSTFIVGGFSNMIFLGVLFYTTIIVPQPYALVNFLIYLVIYNSVLLIQWKSGKELSLQLEAKKKLEEVDDLKNQFIILTSHYLRTPLSVIKNSLSIVKASKNEADLKENLQHIESSTKELEVIVDKFLEISSIEKGRTKIRPSLSDLNLLLNNLVQEFEAEAMDHKVVLIYRPPSQKVANLYLDAVKLKEAVACLIDNAIKYNKPGGSAFVYLTKEDGEVFIQVSDTGEGISKERQENLFKSFSRGGMERILKTDKPGLGLSLYLTKLIVEAHKGKISIISQEGKGSTFTIILPLKELSKKV